MGELDNLQELRIEFGIKDLKYNYHRRHFEFSYQDLENLCRYCILYCLLINYVNRLTYFLSGLIKLSKLKSFSIHRSKFNEQKAQILVDGLLNCPIEELKLLYCNLKCTTFLERFLKVNKTLKILDLKGNKICGDNLHGLNQGIKVFEGHLEYLSLARNAVGGEGLAELLESMCRADQVEDLDLTGCCSQSDTQYILAIPDSHRTLHSLHIACNPISDEDTDKLIKSMKDHYKIAVLDVRECGLTELQEQKLRLLLERNKYFRKYPFLLEDESSEKTTEVESILDKRY